jgi:hypothetical protein
MNTDDLYAVLVQWAKKGTPKTYSQLSIDYCKHTGVLLAPHGTWDAPLGELNNRLHLAGAPALSALVIVKETNEPGAGFWGCSPNVPMRMHDDKKRITAWIHILQKVTSFNWPPLCP